MSHTTATSPAPTNAQRLAMTALIVGGIAIGSSPIFVRLSEVGPLATGFWRLALAVLPLLLMDGRERRDEKDTTRSRCPTVCASPCPVCSSPSISARGTCRCT